MKGIACAGAVIGLFAWPAFALADEDSFVVDTNSASAALTACTGAAADCSLAGAFANADDGDPDTDEDTITFAPAIFDGVETVAGEATVALTSGLTSDEPLVLSASCASPGPCAGIDGPAASNAITATDGTFEMSRLAIFDSGFSGLAYLGFTTELTVSNSWFGLKLDGTADGNQIGLTLTASNSTVGLEGTLPNFFAGNEIGIQVFTAQGAAIRGNVFGVRPNAAIAANTTADIDIQGNGFGDDPQDIVIGAAPNASAICDAGCNLIAAAGSHGIDMGGSGPGTSTASDVDISGNHIGVNALGSASIGTAPDLVDVGEADDVTISGNTMGGGQRGVVNDGSSANLLIQGNSIGLNAAGNAVLAGPTSPAIAVQADPANPVTAGQNRIANPGTIPSSLISIEGGGATVDENSLGLPGVTGSGGQDAIYVFESGGNVLVEENEIAETTGSGILLDGVSSAEVSGNEIGVEGAIGGSGIWVRDDPFSSQSNLIGGADEARANVIEGVAGDAIRIEGAASDFNAVEINLGSEAAGQFLDLVPQEGPGNDPAGPNEGIQKPKIKSVEKEKVKGKAEPDAKVWLFLSRSGEGEVPTGLAEFVDKKGVKDDGTWKIKPDDKIGKNEVLTALQTDSALNSSELTKGKTR